MTDTGELPARTAGPPPRRAAPDRFGVGLGLDLGLGLGLLELTAAPRHPAGIAAGSTSPAADGLPGDAAGRAGPGRWTDPLQ
ncbi:hypothetical protein [Streptomyces sp. NPDC001380]|uniref:hypothetical protein n=1 Tax=Streptomyces sp. NPDC001380 TaxID=3364566 RepID=UPI0036C5D7FF